MNLAVPILVLHLLPTSQVSIGRFKYQKIYKTKIKVAHKNVSQGCI